MYIRCTLACLLVCILGNLILLGFSAAASLGRIVAINGNGFFISVRKTVALAHDNFTENDSYSNFVLGISGS